MTSRRPAEMRWLADQVDVWMGGKPAIRFVNIAVAEVPTAKIGLAWGILGREFEMLISQMRMHGMERGAHHLRTYKRKQQHL